MKKYLPMLSHQSELGKSWVLLSWYKYTLYIDYKFGKMNL